MSRTAIATAVAASIVAAAFGLDQTLANPPATVSNKGASGTVVPKDPEDAPELYPPHPKRDEAFYACVACHSFQLVAQQGMSRDRWDESLTWMTEKHNMPNLEGQDRQSVLDYLATVFPEKTKPGWKNPFQ